MLSSLGRNIGRSCATRPSEVRCGAKTGRTPNREEGLTPPDLTTPTADYASAVDDVLPSNSLTSLAAGPKLVWTKPVVRELFGEERRERLEEIEQADLAANRVACGRAAGVLQ
jgi:hypothetical protein